MSYTVWLDGTRIGETALELRHGNNRRGGVFHPTELGLSVLPSITAMGPALLDAGRRYREDDFIPDDPNAPPESAAAAFFATDEGQRIMLAGELISRLELHDPSGELVPWESLLISDMNELTAVAARISAGKTEPTTPECSDRDPVRYFISAKLISFTRRLRGRAPRVS
jgi:hypothetical protein